RSILRRRAAPTSSRLRSIPPSSVIAAISSKAAPIPRRGRNGGTSRSSRARAPCATIRPTIWSSRCSPTGWRWTSSIPSISTARSRSSMRSRPHVTAWWSTGQQPAQLLLDKEVVLATGWNGRFYDIIKKGAPVEIEWGQGALKQGSFVIPRGAKNVYWAQKMLAEMSVPQQQAVYASELGYPGLNLESLNFVDAKVKPYLPT